MQQIKTILCPVDFSEFSERAIRYAAACAQQFDAKVIVYHCEPTNLAFAGDTTGVPVIWYDDWNNRVKEQMESLLALCKLYNINVVSKIESGDPAAGIVHIAKSENVDLIVMGTHGLGEYETILMGSVTNKVIHKATVPVLALCKPTKTVLSGDRENPLLIGKILCAVDPENLQVPMLSRAISLARFNKSTILFFAVGDSSQTSRALTSLRELILPEKEKLCKVEFRQATGNPVEEIQKAIREFDIDLVIMGHHSRMAMVLDTVGSVTLRVIPRSNCPVLVERDL